MRAILAMSLCLMLCGCAGLIVREDDSILEKTGKVVARILFAIPTMGSSEFISMTEVKRRECWERGMAYQSGVDVCYHPAPSSGSSSPGIMLMLPPLTPSVYQQSPVMPPPQRGLNCTSQKAGNSVYTNCF